MKKLLLLILFIAQFGSSLLHSQNYGNEWINYSQKYFSFKIVQTGWYQMDYTTISNGLSSVGIDISTIPSSQFQLFGREQELSIKVVDGGDGFIDAGDYIEFYAYRNDGWKDSTLYLDPANDQMDTYYSYFNDTIHYFLSYTNGSNGKRIQLETDVNMAAYPSPAYCWVKNNHKWLGGYNLGPIYEGLSAPIYGRGEGYGNQYNKGGNVTANISTRQAYTLAGAPLAKVEAFGSSSSNATNPNSPNNHGMRFSYGSPLVVIADTQFAGYDMIKLNFELNPATFGATTTAFRFSSYNIGPTNPYIDRQFGHAITVIYPHTFNFEAASTFNFSIPNHPTDPKQKITISNFNSTTPKLFVINDGWKELPLVANGANWDVVIPNNVSNDSIQLLMTNGTTFLPAPAISPVMNTGNFTDLNNLNPNEAYIIISNTKLWSSAQQYAAYRQSANGGARDVLLLDVVELYDQFGGGIVQHPAAVKNFLQKGFDEWTSDPKDLFIIGKSVGSVADGGFGTRSNLFGYSKNLVPTFGYPGSDNHLSQGMNNSGKSYGIGTGRLSATHNQQVLDYLEKVMVYEAQQDPNSIYALESKEWQKNVMHFSGSSDPVEDFIIQYNLDLYKTTIEDTLFGGNVKTFFKDPFSSSLNSQDFFDVENRLEEGVSLMTFYGHATSSGGFAQNIDIPQNWNNFEKYPVVIGLGCYTGDVHGIDTITYSDQMVKTVDKGAVAFISTVKLGFMTHIGNYTNYLYHNFGHLNYGGDIGSSMRMTTDTLFSLIGPDYWQVAQESNFTGMALHGDPALKINSHLKPELVLDINRVWTEPSVIDLSTDTIELYVDITNIGKAFNGTFEIQVERSSASGIDSIFTQTLPKLYYRDTVVFKIPTKHEIHNGLNTFNISTDLPFSIISEQYDETNNNQITFSTYVSSNGLIPIWPYEFAIVPWDTMTLKSSTINPFEPIRNYIFEVDTTDLFNSPFKKYQLISSTGGVVEAFPSAWKNSNTNQNQPLSFTDSTVYFWRCSPDSTVKNWYESSFQYIRDHWGWGQAHFFQFKKDYFQGIDHNRTDRTFDFIPNQGKLACNTNVSFVTTAEWNSTNWTVSGSPQDYGGWNWPSIIVGVVDPCTLDSWGTPFCDVDNGTILNTENNFGQFNGDPCAVPGLNNMGRNRPHQFFIFHNNSATQLDSLASMLQNKIPDGHYLVAYTYIPNNYTSPASLYGAWPASLFTAFQNLGATGFTPGMPADGFIFMCKKGDLSTVQEIRTPNPVPNATNLPVQNLYAEMIMEGCETGYIKTVEIGPAQQWNRLYWKQDPMENPSQDTTILSIYGISPTGNESFLMDMTFSNYDSIINLTSLIDANAYPTLKLQATLYDSTNYSPAQIDRWQLIYEPIPELALNPKKGYYFKMANALQQGDSAAFAMAIENVSAFDMDSLKVNYWFNSAGGAITNVSYPRQDSLRSGEILFDTLKFSTFGMEGINYFWITANPYTTPPLQDQIEQFYFNNIAQTSFTIVEDEVNPLLDVTFDGIHILDKDIVSPEPFILITLDDENPFLLMNDLTDTTYFEVKLKRPGSNSFENVYFRNGLGEEILKFSPAVDSKNQVKIEYNPDFQTDGLYTLSVQGRDKSNNFSGDYNYEITFEVINASTITHLFNYPNPFSTSTQFVFTLTGREVPDQMMIQIMTVTGKVVREIKLEELGPINIGNNRTTYAWDGRDEFGDQLANGVYLYHVTAKINGQDIEHRTTSADENSFKKGFGKMYLLR
jgi:hypothetical protein